MTTGKDFIENVSGKQGSRIEVLETLIKNLILDQTQQRNEYLNGINRILEEYGKITEYLKTLDQKSNNLQEENNKWKKKCLESNRVSVRQILEANNNNNNKVGNNLKYLEKLVLQKTGETMSLLNQLKKQINTIQNEISFTIEDKLNYIEENVFESNDNIRSISERMSPPH